MRVLTWNCRGATPGSPLWAYFRELDPDLAILQEVSAVPIGLKASYEIRKAFPRSRSGGLQRFSSVLVVRGVIHEPCRLRSSPGWVGEQLKHFDPT
jgi:hypothetical protein